MFKVIYSGQGRLYWKNIGQSLLVFFSQKTVFKSRPLSSIIHSLIAWAFILYMVVNIDDVINGFIESFHFLGMGIAGGIYRLFVDLFSVLAMISVLYFLLRRFMFNSIRLEIRNNVLLDTNAFSKIKADSLIVGLFIFFHIGFRFIGESIYLNMNGLDIWQPFASLVSGIWEGLSSSNLNTLYHIFWWLAIGLILLFLPYFPKSKHAHLFMGPLNYLTSPLRSSYGTLDPLDFEADDMEQFGAATLIDLDKTQVLDAYACIMCNRCQDVCPAYITGKELSPSALEINKRIYINKSSTVILDNEASDTPLLEYALSPSALWACTTCAACVDICPVGNEPMMDILHIRRDRVLMESDFPKELQGAFNGMERNGNPWNINEDRLKWVNEHIDLSVKTVKENPEFDILYWVGCAGAFDQKGQEIAVSFTRILNHCKVNFAVLGNDEKCTGDSARRAGNEYLFTMLAEENISKLNEAGVKKIVTTCPHCLHTLKNEYPQFGGNYEVVHHTQFINELISSGKLVLDSQETEKLAFHDPCYLGRHNRIFTAPREVISSAGVDKVELKSYRENSLCCGAGGAQMWKEEEPGKEAVRRERFKEVINSGTNTLCTACPFCLTMMSDAGTELNSSIQVKDIADIIAYNIK
jgi:Fe-S oxidoreductase